MNKTAPSATSPALVEAMMEPAFYPKPPQEVIHKETHISHVFLVGDMVYKIKKPVQFSFLDFSTLAKRRHFHAAAEPIRGVTPDAHLAATQAAWNEIYVSWRLCWRHRWIVTL